MEMEMRKESEDEQRMKKGKGKEADPFVFIPDDILLDILKRVPDVFLRCKAKHVCRRWFNTITNRILLDPVSLILQNEKTYIARLVDISDEGVKVQNLDIPIKGKIRSWCNEFLLISHYKAGTSCLYLYNQITKEGSYLPVFNPYCECHNSSRCGVGLSFDRSKGIYKAVHLCVGRTIECQILILGKDVSSSKWKKIEVPYMKEGEIRGDPVLVQGRYMNWKFYYTNDLVSVDMVKEEGCIISLPKSSCSVFEMGGCLALLNDISRNEIELWVHGRS